MEKSVLNKASKERKKADELNRKKTLFKQTFETIHELNISKNKTKTKKKYISNSLSQKI